MPASSLSFLQEKKNRYSTFDVSEIVPCDCVIKSPTDEFVIKMSPPSGKLQIRFDILKKRLKKTVVK